MRISFLHLVMGGSSSSEVINCKSYLAFFVVVVSGRAHDIGDETTSHAVSNHWSTSSLFSCTVYTFGLRQWVTETHMNRIPLQT